MSEESKPLNPAVEDVDSGSDVEDQTAETGAVASPTEGSAVPKKKKKKSKKKKISNLLKSDAQKTAEAFIGNMDDPSVTKENSAQLLTKNNMSLDPALGQQSLEQLLKQVKLQELLTGMAPGGKNKKDMADYKFWKTQPVAPLGENVEQDGVIQEGNVSKIPKEPLPMHKEFEWVTMNLEDPAELKELYELLTANYVEDDDAMFRFDYSASFLDWALKSPGWLKEWHVGVRVASSKKLVAFISGIPLDLRVRDRVLKASEINFLCVHKKLRSKRLAPILIKEITRRCNLEGVFQAIYTGGVVLPTPVSVCRYYHRSLNWPKLCDVGFSALPRGSTVARQVLKYKLPEKTKTKGLRPMTYADVPRVGNLLRRFLSRFEMSQGFDDAEVAHWMLQNESIAKKDRVIWAYVVEDGAGNITDFFSFYSLPSSIIGHPQHKVLNAAYLFYYATETAFLELPEHDLRPKLSARLNELVNDALVLAKKLEFDVFNALSLADNAMFLDEQKFGAGDGYLNFYLFNYKARPMTGGFLPNGQLDQAGRSSVGFVPL
ncbi:N-myristoyl transferase [Saitoella complicata NRRL Y-17804]|uniref:Glycylpeptide N-tetradecanoyltransferase n=1 Tax=Saitoella complicata (strain BCRC 22490 / CBS 7301 / JCM 7358 / NBRC 10748 / NRRL Y-17804) TaxID=698492 RepID=A0A0E9NHR3_SAICN|nr:N-myristoyl transferase [Saitoella complicata NRRL Y-17804]ODQ51183.1 N-myristoyl transferase [Saitoella complicata NRRL Y-17804]GAO49241.1 hypothetical protein G7K_3395-t1 [Saitoella complicata NRRL Y-17804]